MAKKPRTSDELAAQADELMAQAKAMRKEANAAKRREKREAEKRAAEQLARDEAGAIQYAKKMTITVSGETVCVYDWLMDAYRKSLEPSE